MIPSMSGFQEEYAAIYDLLYAEKNYEEESQLVRKVINEFTPDAKILLDYGCGTGNHAKEFASHGFDVWGLDKNESMLKIARERLRDVPNIELRHVEDRDLIPPDSVDVCTTLFDVISYMNTNEEIVDFLSYVRRILVKKGLLIFDFWYGPGVIALGPEKRCKEFDLGEQSILRLTSPQHDRDACVVTVTHKVVLSDDAVSRRHALIRNEQDNIIVFDLGSRTGTQVDGETLGGHVLSAGETITLGTTELVLMQPGSGEGSASDGS